MSYQDKEKPRGLKKARPIRAIGKGFGKLLGVNKKSKADKEAEEAAFQKRAHFAPKTAVNDSNRDSLENSKSFMELQNAYYENKEVQEPAKDISQYKSVHRDDYRAVSKPMTSDYENLEQPGEKDQEEALAREDYQTRLRVERANQRKKQLAIDPSQVDQSHRQFGRRNRANAPESMAFESNFENGFQDQFQMINADKNYFDENMQGQNDQDDEDEMFLNQMNMLEQGNLQRGRTQAFADDLDGIVFGGDFGKPQKDDSLDFDDDGAFGEIGTDNKVIMSNLENDDDGDEEADVVGELGAGDNIFDTSQKNDLFEGLNSRQRTASASMIDSALFKGLEEIKKECEDPFNDLDERLKQAAMQTDKEFDVGRSSMKRESFVQKTRQALKIRKIQREIEQEKNQGIVEEGSMAGLPRLIPLRPRTNMYDQMAKSKIDQFYQNDDQEYTEEQQQEIEERKELNLQIAKYRNVLDHFESHSQEMSEEQKQDNQKMLDQEMLKDHDDEEYDNFLDDFYQEMNRDPQRSLENTNLSSQDQKTVTLDYNPIQDSNDKFDFTQESTDMIKFIDWNERRHRETALKYLKVNSQLHYQGINNDELKQHRLTGEQPLRQISEQMMMERQFNNSKATCVALSEDLIIVGNTLGELWMYDRDTQEKYDCFKMDQKNKDFQSNAITVIEIHPARSEYVLIGYNFGQIVLIDVTDPGKSLKVIKDHHKGSSVSNLAFCEWNKQKSGKQKPIEQAQNLNVTLNDPSDLQNPYGRSESNVYMQNPMTQQKQANLTEWMFISMDSNGKVLVNTIQKVLLILKTNKQVLAESKRGESKFQSLSTRFKSDLHPQQKINDIVSLAAIANYERIQIFAISQSKSQLIREVLAPTFVRFEKTMTLEGCLPSLNWGFAHSPVLKDKCYASLVIGWGPLIQMLVLNDVMDEKQIFIDDGFVVIQNEQIRQIMESQEKENGINPKSVSLQKEDEQIDDRMERSESAAMMDQINPFLQNQRFEALQQARNIKQATRKTGIVMSPFDMPDLFIEKIFFLSESIILVVTRSLEIRIFYTQKLNHGPYNSDFKDNKKKSQSVNPEIDNGQIINNLTQSEFGQIYNQTIRAFNGMVIGLGAQGMFRFIHLSWNDSLIQFKKIVQGNWVQELMRAIDIYTGKVKGFRDVPEQEEMRQETMKAELKLLIRNIIIEQLQKWAQQEPEPKEEPASQEQLDESNVDILENLQILDDLNKNEKQQKYRTMIRIAIEFCVTIQDCQFLFYDVFLLFQEEQLEQIFLDELKPFIISGRFSDWQMPEDILQNNIINYYKDPDQPETIEKIITNLNLKECPKSVILELIQFSEKNFLSSALLYLHTAVFDTKDDASCIHCILALLSLYSQAKEDNPGTMDEIRAIRDLSPDSIERMRAEKSHLYLGYKILWVIRMFLNGKKWPSGNIPQARWKNYVHEIVDCISQKNIMLDLLYIDAEAYFQIISICFYKGLVFDFIKSGKQQADKMIKAQVDLVHNPLITSDVWEETMIHLSHNQLLERFDNVCQSRVDHDFLVPDSIRLQYLFFVANVASKASISKDAAYYYSCMIELLNKSQLFLNFNKQLLERAFTRKKRWGQQTVTNLVPQAVLEESKHMYISENALMELIELCEPLEDEQIQLLIEKTQYTEFYHLRVKLYEKREDYVQCLQLIIEGFKIKEYSSNQEAVERAFVWIMNILDLLEAKKSVANPESTGKEDLFRRNIMTNFKGLVKLDPFRCVELIDDKFKEKLQEYMESLNNHSEEQFLFLDALLSMHNEMIQALIEEYFMLGSEKEKANMYMVFQCLHLKLLCQIHPLKVLNRIRDIKNNQVKLEENRLIECLDICQEAGQVEAQAMLMYKMTNYMSSATQYMTLITAKEAFDYPTLIKQISEAPKFPHFQPYLDQEEKKRKKQILRVVEQGFDSPQKQEHGETVLTAQDFSQSKIIRFDYIIRKVIKICNRDSTDNYSEETIDKMWFFTLDQIMKIKNEQIKMLEAIKGQKIVSIDDLQERDQATLISGEQQPGQIQKLVTERYEAHIRNVEMFFKSRIDSVIENILKYIELDDFLNHIVKKDENLKYEELTNMIHSIFSEKNSECVVLANANKSAKQQIISQFNSASNDYSTGILFRYRQCNICNKFLDEEVKSLKKKAELLSHARRGTMIGHSGNIGDDEEDMLNQFSIADEDKMRLYDCGHAFHIECIKSYQRDQITAENQKGVVQKVAQSPKEVKITKTMLDKQRCPWCYSEKFKIDIETLFSEKQARKGGNLVSGRKQVGVSTKEEAENEDIEDDDSSMDFNQDKIGSFRHGSSVMRRRRDAKFTGSMIQRGKMDIQEQRMQVFDSSVFNEGVTRHNFLIEQ